VELNLSREYVGGNPTARTTLSCGKLKEAEHFADIRLTAQEVHIPEGTSLVLSQDDSARIVAKPALNAGELASLEALREHPGGLTLTEWEKACNVSRATIQRRKDRMVQLGAVRQNGDGQGAQYFAVVEAVAEPVSTCVNL